MKILDIGSGNAVYAKEIHSSNDYYSIDYPTTNERYQSRPQVYADARSLPVGDYGVDVVFLFEVLEHIPDAKSVLQEIRRVLKPQGVIYFSVPFLYPMHDEPNDYWRFTVHGLAEISKANGFETTEIIPHGNTLVVGLQIFNLGLLEVCLKIIRTNLLLGLLIAATVYPLTLGVNLLAWPLLYLPLGTAGCLGYFLVARKGSS